MHRHGVRNNTLNLIRHHTKLPAKSILTAIIRLVVEKIEANAERVNANLNN